MARNAKEEAAADAAAKDGAAQVDATAIEVICQIAAGRRRAGRRWPGGSTVVAASDLTEAEWAELEADPMFALRDAPDGAEIVPAPAAGE